MRWVTPKLTMGLVLLKKGEFLDCVSNLELGCLVSMKLLLLLCLEGNRAAVQN